MSREKEKRKNLNKNVPPALFDHYLINMYPALFFHDGNLQTDMLLRRFSKVIFLSLSTLSITITFHSSMLVSHPSRPSPTPKTRDHNRQNQTDEQPRKMKQNLNGLGHQ